MQSLHLIKSDGLLDLDDEVNNDFATLTGCLSFLNALKLDLGGIWSLFFPFDASGLHFILIEEVAIGFTLRTSPLEHWVFG